jgi:hypothetical protein
MDLIYTLTRLDHGFGLKDPTPYRQINEWVFPYGGQYVTGLCDINEELMIDGHHGGQ